jgi:ribosomal protein S18 acetylase RimI-like enzyme
MLTEIRDVRQVGGEGSRRWFTDPSFDLIVWYDGGAVVGFQLCYDKQVKERALTWHRPARYTHMRIDTGEQAFGTKATPVLVQDGVFERDAVLGSFLEASTSVEPAIVELVSRALAAYREPPPRRAALGLTIRALAPELAADYLAFFDSVAFADNPDWASCYCCFYQLDPAAGDFSKRTGAENRAYASQLIAERKLKGYLAYSEGRVVGWCNANDKSAYTLLATQPELQDKGKAGVCAVVCFVVAPALRGNGIATRLLAHVCADYHQQGYDYVEAYPRKEVAGSAANYHGPLSMYQAAGFRIHRELESSWVVRKDVW